MASPETPTPEIPSASRQHFVFLDGMRGVAALCVACLHAAQLLSLQPVPLHAGLAVDFFFCLSGFVIAYAYDARLSQGLGAGPFALKRLIRLYPMILLGVLLGGGVSLGKVVIQHSGDAGQIVALTLSALCLVPLGLWYGLQAFPVNNPIWSLFFELAANAVYAVTGARYGLRTGLLILMASACAVIWAVVIHDGVDTIGFLDTPSFLLGFVRVTYPFLAGLLLYRSRLFERLPALPSWLIATGLVAFLMAPSLIAGPGFDLVAILVILPGIVAFGARSHSSPVVSRVWTVLGQLSYPFYLVHQPIIRAVGQLGARLPVAAGHPVILAGVSLLLSGVFAAVAFWFYDKPLRKLLHKRTREFASA